MDPFAYPETPAAAVVSAPRSVVGSFWLFLIASAVQIISVVVSIASFGNVVALLPDQPIVVEGVSLSREQLDAIVMVSLGIGVAIGLIMTAAQVLFAFLMRRGANWARIVLTVFAGLSLLAVFGANPLVILSVVIDVFAVLMAWRKPSNAWFRSIGKRKRSLRNS